MNAQLKGSTLGDASKDDTLSAKTWIKAQKKRASRRERELAERRQREMDEADRVAYGEEDLSGLKVSHGADAFEEGETILTLKDTRVLDGGEDELQNVNLADEERLEAARERKRKAAQTYTGYDDEEFEEGRIGKKAGVLSKYDADFAGGEVETEGFRLGAPIPKKETVVVDEEMMGREAQVKVKLDLDLARDWEVSDYMKEGDPGFKKPKVSDSVGMCADRQKRRTKKSTRRAEADEDEMDVDAAPTFTKRVVGDTPDNLVDDDDLQAALARARRQVTKKKPKSKPEDLAARSKSSSQTADKLTPQSSKNERRSPRSRKKMRPTTDASRLMRRQSSFAMSLPSRARHPSRRSDHAA